MRRARPVARVLTAVCALSLALGCAPKKEQERAHAENSHSDKDKDSEAEKSESASPNPFAGPMAAGLLGQMLTKSTEPGPFDPPDRSEGARASAPHVAVLSLAGAVSELSAPFSLLGARDGVTLRELITRVHALLDDENVTALVLRVDGLELSYAAAEELRAALSSHDKPIYCHVEEATDLPYMVLTACTSIGLAPMGTVAITGPAVTPLYLRGLLDKLGIETDFLHVGAYKGAAEPLTRDAPSAEMKETYQALLDGAYARLLDALAKGRHVERAQAQKWVDQALFTSTQAKAAGLVDDVNGFEAWRDKQVGEGQWMAVKLGGDRGAGLEALLELLGARPKPRIRAPHVALLYAVGEVVDGVGNGPTSASQEIASRHLVGALRAAADDTNVKAMVLRVDSPGGSALASELIWHAVRYAQAKKPVVVSMGYLAASGGYYISSGAQRIFAQPDTLTGSIGVVGGKIVLGPALRRLGVNVYEMGAAKRSLLMSSTRKWSQDERAAMSAHMQDVYDTFKQRVAEGRKLSIVQVETIAQGRLWIGADAKERGLIDALGGLEDALTEARKLGGLPKDAPTSVYPAEPTLLDFLGQLGGNTRAATDDGAALISAWNRAGVGLVLGAELSQSLASTLIRVEHFRREPVRVISFVQGLR